MLSIWENVKLYELSYTASGSVKWGNNSEFGKI